MEPCYMCHEDEDGVTPMEYFLKYGDRNTRLTVLAKRSFRTCRPNGETALHLLLQNKKIAYVPKEEILLLLSKGFDVNMRDEKGISPLTWCVKNKLERIAEFLMKNGAKANWLEIVVNTRMLKTLTDPKYYHYEREYYHKIMEMIFHQQLNTNTQNLYKTLNKGLINTPDNLFYAQIAIAHLVIAEAAGERIPYSTSDYIKSKIQLKESYDICRARILEMGTITVNGSVTLLQLLTATDDEIDTYICNQDFMLELKNLLSQKCFKNLYYAIVIRKRVKYAMRVMELRKIAGRVICELTGLCMHGVDEHHYVVYKILSYLTKTDIINLFEDELVTSKSPIFLLKTQKAFGTFSKSIKNIFSFTLDPLY